MKIPRPHDQRHRNPPHRAGIPPSRPRNAHRVHLRPVRKAETELGAKAKAGSRAALLCLQGVREVTQGRQIIAHLKRKAMTYGDMHRLGISTSPQKRVMECLLPTERVIKSRVGGLIRWRVISATRWTA